MLGRNAKTSPNKTISPVETVQNSHLKTERYQFKVSLSCDKNNKLLLHQTGTNHLSKAVLRNNMPSPNSRVIDVRFFILPKSDFGFEIQQTPTIIKITQAQKINKD